MIKKTAKFFFGILLIVMGIGLYVYPVALESYQSYETKRYIKTYEEKWEKVEKKENLQKEIEAYNKEIYETKQKDFCDAWSYTQPPVSLKELQDGEYGYIKIPAMDVKLPLYIGASEENLRKGAAILGQTSIPIGKDNENSVIAGHRGYQGIPFFREIERLEKGDEVIIKNPWKELTYYVDSIAVINPYDNDAVRIQDGETMVTLVTCHPYRTHGKYRYIVYCKIKGEKDIVEKKKVKEEKIIETTGKRFESSEPAIKQEDIARKIGGAILILFVLYMFISFRKKELTTPSLKG